MLRKSLVLLFSLMLMITGTAQAQDINLDINITIHLPAFEKSLASSVLFREQDLVVLSDLFPSFAVTVPETVNPEAILGFFPSDGTISLKGIGDSVVKAAALVQTDRISGIYSGDLFDDATVLQTGSIKLTDFISSVNSAPDTQYNPVSALFEVMAQSLTAGVEEKDLSDVVILYSIFDEGKYLSLNVIKDDATLATASFDFSQDASYRSVFGYAENGKNYYWDIELNESAENQIRIQSALFSDAAKEGFRCARNGAPVLESSWTLSMLPTLREIVVTGMFVPSNDLDPILLNGVIEAKETPALSMDLHFNSAEDKYLSFVVKTGSEKPDLSNWTLLSVEDLSSSETVTSFTNEISLNLLTFYSAFIQTIPMGYQQLLMMLD